MIKALIVDDSPLIRQLLKEILSSHSELTVVATARDPYDAREKIKIYNPDVITLDVEMPRMDGLTFLKNLMRLRPIPVVMISSLTEKGASVTLQALELGAVDFLEKPRFDKKQDFNQYAELITTKVINAAKSRVRSLKREKADEISHRYQKNKTILKQIPTNTSLIAIGASTGGTEAIKELLVTLPTRIPPIVIVQHIPPVFSSSYAKRLDALLDSIVTEVNVEDTKLIPGHIYLAPGDRHMKVVKKQDAYWAILNDDPPINRHRPAVDVLFSSVAESVNDKAIGVILTGMGSDGAKGLLAMKKTGAMTIAQDKESSVVWGMPGSAVEMKSTCEVLALNKIGPRIIKLIQG